MRPIWTWEKVIGPHILVVVDDPAMRQLLTAHLTARDYRVSCAEDGRRALDRTALDVPDLILSAVQLPQMHGLTLVERVRADGHTMPIILMSSGTPASLLLGVRFVEPPFDLDLITAAVAQDLARAGNGRTTIDTLRSVYNWTAFWLFVVCYVLALGWLAGWV